MTLQLMMFLGYKLYPTPANNQLVVEYPSGDNLSNQMLDIYDMLGKKVASYQLPANDDKLTLNVANIPAGLYLYTITSGDSIQQRGKIMIQR